MAKWDGKTRGNVLGYRIFILAIKILGLSGGYFLLKFVSFYFYLFLTDKKAILEDFYANRVGILKSKVKPTIRENFFQLGQSLIDKIAFSLQKAGKITYQETGEDFLRKLVEKKQGAFLVSGHVGNWDIAGNLLTGINARVSVVMFENEHENIKTLLESQGSVPKFNIIPVSDDMSHLIEIYSAIKRGDLVCLHADRYLEGAKTELIDFFGKPAKFPIGPFQLIEKMKVPYSFVFALKKERFQYYFSATEPVYPSKKASEIAYDFAKLLEQKVKEHPEQWFNYYDFYTLS